MQRLNNPCRAHSRLVVGDGGSNLSRDHARFVLFRLFSGQNYFRSIPLELPIFY
jgi:hypothetical protein